MSDPVNLMTYVMLRLTEPNIKKLAGTNTNVLDIIGFIEAKKGYWYQRLKEYYPEHYELIMTSQNGLAVNPRLIWDMLQMSFKPDNIVENIYGMIAVEPYYTDAELIRLIEYLAEIQSNLDSKKLMDLEPLENRMQVRKVIGTLLSRLDIINVLAKEELSTILHKQVLPKDKTQLNRLLEDAVYQRNVAQVKYLLENSSVGASLTALKRAMKSHRLELFELLFPRRINKDKDNELLKEAIKLSPGIGLYIAKHGRLIDYKEHASEAIDHDSYEIAAALLIRYGGIKAIETFINEYELPIKAETYLLAAIEDEVLARAYWKLFERRNGVAPSAEVILTYTNNPVLVELALQDPSINIGKFFTRAKPRFVVATKVALTVHNIPIQDLQQGLLHDLNSDPPNLDLIRLYIKDGRVNPFPLVDVDDIDVMRVVLDSDHTVERRYAVEMINNANNYGLLELLLSDPRIKAYVGASRVLLPKRYGDNYFNMLKLWLEAGGDSNVDGGKLLKDAVQLHYGIYPVVKLLLEYGADKRVVSNEQLIQLPKAVQELLE